MSSLLEMLNIRLPVVLAPMAGVTTPALAAAVSNAGGLGSIGVGSVDAKAAQAMIRELRQLTSRPFNVNVFCHATPRSDSHLEAEWCAALEPSFVLQGQEPPPQLEAPFKSFLDDPDMLAMLLEERPPVMSFHFGLPIAETIKKLRRANITLLATATNPHEARSIEAAGVNVIVAQGYEAGGHRGMFDPQKTDDRLGTLALTRLLVQQTKLPVIAAGGIMDGAGINACLSLGAGAAQMGTAFIACPESSADPDHRRTLMSDATAHTVMTAVFSGRPARALPNRFTALALNEQAVPSFPIAYVANKALAAAAKAGGEAGFAAQWAGQGAPLTRPMPAAKLVERLESEMRSG